MPGPLTAGQLRADEAFSVRAFYQSATIVPCCIHLVLPPTRSTEQWLQWRRSFITQAHRVSTKPLIISTKTNNTLFLQTTDCFWNGSRSLIIFSFISGPLFSAGLGESVKDRRTKKKTTRREIHHGGLTFWSKTYVEQIRLWWPRVSVRISSSQPNSNTDRHHPMSYTHVLRSAVVGFEIGGFCAERVTQV